MPKTRIKAVVIVVSILFASTLSMFAQASQKPAAQSVSGGSEQSSTVKDQDIEILRADLRFAAEAGHRANYGPHRRGGGYGLNALVCRADVFVLTPAGAYVGQWLQSFREFPPRQKPGSFNRDRVMEAVTRAHKAQN